MDAFIRMKLQGLLVSVPRQHAITLILVMRYVDEARFLADHVVTMGAHPGVVMRKRSPSGFPAVATAATGNSPGRSRA